MGDTGGIASVRSKMKGRVEDEDDSEEEVWDSDDDDETIARIQRAHYAQAAAMNNPRRRPPPRPRPMSYKRKLEAVKNFHDFTKKLKKDTGVSIRSLVGNNILELSDFSSEDSKSDSDGLSEEEFVVNPNAVEELEEENESYIDPVTGDIVEGKKTVQRSVSSDNSSHHTDIQQNVEPKTLSISDIINEGGIDLSKNVEIAEVETSELCPDKIPEELLDMKQDEASQDFDESDNINEMHDQEVKPQDKSIEDKDSVKDEKKPETEEEKKLNNLNAINVRRNIREVMDEKNLDASTLTAQRQESERLARVQEQQRIIREVQRQIAMNRQNKIHQKTISLLQGGSSILKKSGPGQKLNLPNSVTVKMPSGEIKKTIKHGQVEMTKVQKPTTSAMFSQKLGKLDQKSEKKEVVEIVDSSSGEETSSSSSDSDDCIMLSDSEVPPSPEAEEDPANSGLHVNDTYNIPDEQGRVLINIGHPETEEDIFLAPQIARIIKPHQIGGVRFLFDNIIESVERFSTSTGFGCILAHSMGLGKTLQIVSFCDIFLRHTTSKTVLCIMPINTLQNWVAEFNMWLPLEAGGSALAAQGEVRTRSFPIYVLNDSHKTLQMRAKVVKDWTATGGVLMIGYELYRLLSMKKDKKPRKKKKAELKAEADKEKEAQKNDKIDKNDEETQGSESNMSKPSEESRGEKDETKDDTQSKTDQENKERDEKKDDRPVDEDKKLLDEMYEALVRPGPDLVICDEGHRIKNSHSNISYALKQMRTKRRIVLTGYPLQNNLLEYWCMVDFVRPNYLGSKTEFCNMFERPIQNGQCIDSTPQDIRLMRYRAHVLHSLLVGFVQRRSHAVLQSTLPQKEEYVLLVRMTPLQRKLYDKFMNEVVRTTSVPNPLKAFAICCKIWNHPDVLYNFLRKRHEVNMAIEEDLDLEEIGGVTKAGRQTRSRGNPKKAAKPRGSKKPAATIPPNTTGLGNVRQNAGSFGNTAFPPNGPYPGPPGLPGQPAMPDSYRPGRPDASYPPYQEYHNSGQGYYPPNQGYNQEFNSNYYQQPQPPYGNNYPNQYPQNNSDCSQGYNQNYWNNSNYYGNPGYYNNPQYPNSQPQPEFAGNPPPNFNNSQPYPSSFNTMDPNNPPYPNNQVPQYPSNQDNFTSQHRPPFQGPLNQTTPGYPTFDSGAPAPTNYPNSQPPQNYSNTPYQPPSFPGNSASYGSNIPPAYNQYGNPNPNYPAYGNNPPPNQPQNNPLPNQTVVKTEMNVDPNYQATDRKPEPSYPQNSVPFENSFNFHQQNPLYPDQSETGASGSYPCQYPPFSSTLETKPPLDSAGSPVTSWPMTDTIKTEIDKLKLEDKIEMKSESDGEVKIEDLDTKKIVKDETKREPSKLAASPKNQSIECPTKDVASKDTTKSDKSESDEAAKKGKQKGKGKDSKKADKPKARGRPKAKGRKDRKSSKDKNNEESESEESEKEEKMNKEEELAMVKKAEEMTYDWATELLKDYVPGIIENSAKMEIFFYLLNESIKVGDRLLLFSQSLFTLNLIEDFLEKNYIPGTVSLWQRNVSYYRLDGSTHALEREKLINEFNSNPNIYLFLVSTRAGSLGINLVGANRVIVFDASWNPCHDTQAVCRVYRYGQQKPCFVYRFVMDWCLEKKIYDRQINKQGMADRVVDECNPDAVLSMKEITNLCFDNDENESEVKDLSEHAEKYVDFLMQGILTQHGKLLSKEPFQHESLLVDRKEKKLSSAEKRLAQRGYELEKKAALAPKPTAAYRAVRCADGTVVQRPVASVRPMQHARWIPADVWRRQGMTAQEMTLPLDVVIPTNSAEKTNIVLKAGQRVMVLKSPKGIYMQLESGKIIAIKTSLKGLQKGSEVKEGTPIGKKVLTNRAAANIPGSLKNNSAITITSKTGLRPGMQRVMSRPSLLGANRMRPVLPGQKIAEIRNRLGDMKSYTAMRQKIPMNHARMLRPNLPGSVSITRIPKQIKKPTNIVSNESKKMDLESDEDPQLLDSDEEEDSPNDSKEQDASEQTIRKEEPERKEDSTDSQKSDAPQEPEKDMTPEKDQKSNESEPMVLTTDEKLPPEDALENKSMDDTHTEMFDSPSNLMNLSHNEMHEASRIEKKINLLKNYRHQRPFGRPQTESSLTQLERTASTLNNEGIPDFRRNLDDITQSYSPNTDEKPNKSRKKKSPTKIEITPEPQPVSVERPPMPITNMSHSVSSLLGSSTQKPRVDPMLGNHLPKPRMSDSIAQNLSLSAPRPNPLAISHENQISPLRDYSMGQSLDHSKHMAMGPPLGNLGLMGGPPVTPNIDVRKVPGALGDPLSSPMGSGALKPVQPTPYPTPNPPPEVPYAQYPGYGMGYGAYPNPAYYAGYGGAYYPAYAPPTTTASVPPPDNYLPSNQQW